MKCPENRDNLRPPQVDWRLLDPGSYALLLPGFPTEVRATTRAETFEDHFESHEFLGPGNRIYDQLVNEMSQQPGTTLPQLQAGNGSPKLNELNSVQWASGTDAPTEIQTLNELLTMAEKNPASIRLSTPAETVIFHSGDA